MRTRFMESFPIAVPLLLAVAACSERSAESPSPTAPFKVNAASVVAQSSSYTGACPVNISFLATVFGQVPSSGTYQYTYVWERENGQKAPSKTSSITVSATPNVSPYSFSYSEPVYTLAVAQTTTGSLRMHVTDPNDVLSGPVSFSVTCMTSGAVLSQKTLLTVPTTFALDLEQGLLAEPYDIWYELVSRAEWYLVPGNGASIALYGTSEPGYAGCSSVALSHDRLPLNGVAKGTYLCVKTRNGHIAQVRLDQVPVPDVGEDIVLSYTTWF